MFFRILLTVSALALVSADNTLLSVGVVTECDGKDGGNYTFLDELTTDDACSETSIIATGAVTMTLNGPNHQKTVNSLKALASASFPAGGYQQLEVLSLVTGGNLVGKYVYKKVIRMTLPYLKKCSSVLGYSYITSKSLTALISDNLDINVLISPTGGFEAFKKGCTTVCSGQEYVV